jgi:hypothetical protein
VRMTIFDPPPASFDFRREKIENVWKILLLRKCATEGSTVVGASSFEIAPPTP